MTTMLAVVLAYFVRVLEPAPAQPVTPVAVEAGVGGEQMPAFHTSPLSDTMCRVKLEDRKG